ncbi:hypothetical protein L208DRAFT_1419266 [Tricholoma matsutake]|nr:hypothetical protein L208DRAFT_1419266 [Tricholoma matsutake 945]
MLIDVPTLPNVKEAIIAVHSLPAQTSVQMPVYWPMLKNLVVVFEIGITDFLAHIEMPAVEVLWLIFPKWLLWLLSGPQQFPHQSVTSYRDDSDDKGEDDNSDNESEYKALSYDNHKHPDQHCFDSLPHLSLLGLVGNCKALILNAM